VHGLSGREQEVLELIAAGESNKAIARQLCICLDTVKHHATNIYTKLDVRNRAEAARWWAEHRDEHRAEGGG
jgi:DNA-binding NarL/FixJ family response regulator